MNVDDFDFDLPRTAIADRPVSPRDAAKMLRVRQDGLTDLQMADLPGQLRAGDLLISNDTRVIPARLFGQRGQARIEATLHQQTSLNEWLAFARPGKRLRVGDRIEWTDSFSALVRDKKDDGQVLLAFDRGGADLLAALEDWGKLPLPPYIHRDNGADERDRSDYQTLFAREPGAVAAPTAGLHFTPELLAALDQAGVQRATLTLHVGAGTFLPVKVADTRDHRMHSEQGTVTAELAAQVARTRAAGGRIVAVGTTALRLLESASTPDGVLHPFQGSTDIFITPGYRFRQVDLLMTNFHLPRSTLFMLVSAFAGLERMKSAYAHALRHDYRFYSYGDGSLLDRAPFAELP